MSKVFPRYPIYARWRFAVCFQNNQKPEDFGEEYLSLSRVWSDPFCQDIWMERAHCVDDRAFVQASMSANTFDVWMVDRSTQFGKIIRVFAETVDYLPFDLDAADSRPAMERLHLKGVSYSFRADVPYDELPKELQEMFVRHA